jgi:hypothetical protein
MVKKQKISSGDYDCQADGDRLVGTQGNYCRLENLVKKYQSEKQDFWYGIYGVTFKKDLDAWLNFNLEGLNIDTCDKRTQMEILTMIFWKETWDNELAGKFKKICNKLRRTEYAGHVYGYEGLVKIKKNQKKWKKEGVLPEELHEAVVWGNDPYVWYLFGVGLYWIEQKDEAYRWFYRAVREKKDFVKAYCMMGKCAPKTAKEDYDFTKRECFLIALSFEKDYADALFYLFYYRYEEYKEARALSSGSVDLAGSILELERIADKLLLLPEGGENDIYFLLRGIVLYEFDKLWKNERYMSEEWFRSGLEVDEEKKIWKKEVRDLMWFILAVLNAEMDNVEEVKRCIGEIGEGDYTLKDDVGLCERIYRCLYRHGEYRLLLEAKEKMGMAEDSIFYLKSKLRSGDVEWCIAHLEKMEEWEEGGEVFKMENLFDIFENRGTI